MLYRNALILTSDGYRKGGFRVENGCFTEILPDCPLKEGEDLNGLKVIPGLVDIHTHGCVGYDFSDGSPNGLKTMAAYYAKKGITTFVPTSVTMPYDALDTAFRTAKKLQEKRPSECACIGGIHMEGPFFSEKKKGAQNAEFLKEPDTEAFLKLNESCGRLIRIVDIAPELPEAISFIERIHPLCTVSVGHTDASYEQATAAFSAGAKHVTHLFNAMPSLHHRAPGVIGAAADRTDVTVEVISDGIHVHPSMVRLAFRLFPDRVCLISDSVRCCGMPEGLYELGGQRIWKKDGVARLDDGTIAGAASNLYDDLKRAIRFGIPEENAIRAATIIPAKVIGQDDSVGSIETGKCADFIVCDDKLAIRQVYIGGIRI